jgi:hypothetical protein
MKDKSKLVMWICVTILASVGMKYVPPYLVQERTLDLQERALDLREEAFLRQQATPRVSLPTPAHSDHAQML